MERNERETLAQGDEDNEEEAVDQSRQEDHRPQEVQHLWGGDWSGLEESSIKEEGPDHAHGKKHDRSGRNGTEGKGTIGGNDCPDGQRQEEPQEQRDQWPLLRGPEESIHRGKAVAVGPQAGRRARPGGGPPLRPQNHPLRDFHRYGLPAIASTSLARPRILLAPARVSGGEGGGLALLVGANDLVDQFVANDVLLAKVLERNPLDIVQDRTNLDESRDLSGGEVHLGDVAGDHCLRVEPEAGEEHLHLLGGGVLRLIEDDEGVIQGAPPHESEGGNLDDAHLDEAQN